MFQGFPTRQTFLLPHSEFIKRTYNDIIDHTGEGKDFYFSEMGSTLCIVGFLSRHERRGFFYFLEDGFDIKCIYGSSYYKLLCDVSSKKNHQELFLGSFDSPYTENARKVIVASVNLGGNNYL